MPIDLDADERNELVPAVASNAKDTHITVNIPPIEIPAVRLNPVIHVPPAVRTGFRMVVVKRDFNRDIEVVDFTPLP
jgi:hypothetical protein